MIARLAFVLPLCLGMIGCAADQNAIATSSSAYEVGDLGTLTYRAVDLILAAAPDVTRTTPLVVASLTDAQNLDTSSELGNIVADMIRTRLAQTGHKTSEVGSAIPSV